MANIKTISAQDFGHIAGQKGVVLDVRTPEEHAEKHLATKHIHVPLDRLEPKDFMEQHAAGGEQPVYLLCRGGKRATVAAEKFIAEGYDGVVVIEGGLLACEACDHAVEGAGTGI